MSGRVLFATDGSRDASEAGEFLKRLPLPPGTEIHVVSVAASWAVPPVAYVEGGPLLELEQIEREEYRRVTDAARKAEIELSRNGVTTASEVLRGEPAHQIIQAAKRLPASLVVLGSKGLTGLEGFLLGSVARNVAKHAPCPVLIARPAHNELREVVIGIDGSEHGKRAVEAAAGFPLPEGTRLTVTHVTRPYEPYTGLVPLDPAAYQREVEEVRRRRSEAAGRLLGAASERIKSAGRRVTDEHREGDAATEILALASERGADLIVVGARGVSLIEGLVMGSVADRLLKDAGCSLLIVR